MSDYYTYLKKGFLFNIDIFNMLLKLIKSERDINFLSDDPHVIPKGILNTRQNNL